MQEYEEKRDFIRMQADCKMSYRPAGGEDFTEGRCINISGSGMLFWTTTPLGPGQALEVHITPEHRITPPLTAYLEVLRCDPIEAGYQIAGVIKGIRSD